MAKDYAKYQSGKQSIEKGWVTRLILSLFVLLILSIAVGGFYLYKNKQNEILLWVHKAESYFKRENNETKVVAKKSVKKEPEIHFEFYTELPKMNVSNTVTNTAVTPPRDQIIQKEAQYIIQLGIFKSESEADEKRISLLLLGLEAVDLVKTEQGYQLRQGSFNEFSSAKAAQKKLKKMGIEADIKKE